MRRSLRLAPRRKIRAMGESFNDPEGVLGEAKRTHAMNGNTYLDNQILQTIEQISDPNKKLKALMAFKQGNLNNDTESDKEDQYYEYTDDDEHENEEYYDGIHEDSDEHMLDEESYGCTNDHSDVIHKAQKQMKDKAKEVAMETNRRTESTTSQQPAMQGITTAATPATQVAENSITELHTMIAKLTEKITDVQDNQKKMKKSRKKA